MTKVAFPTDEHRPFQDDRAVALAQRIVSDFKPDILIRGSDGLDFYSVSYFQKSRKVFAGQLADEINSWKQAEKAWGDTVDSKCRKYFLIGNHEDRLRKYILSNAPMLEGIEALELQNLLDFQKFGIRLAYNNEVTVDGKLLVKHGNIVRKHSAYTARGELEKEMYGITMMTGHTHRGGTHYATTRQGVVAAYEGFCLCDLNPSYMNGAVNWQQGILLATVHPAGVQVEQVPFFRKGQKLYAHWRDNEYKE